MTVEQLETIRDNLITALSVAPQPDSGEDGFWVKWQAYRTALWAELEQVEAKINELSGYTEEETIALLE